jgi:hypothetical protein
MHDRENTADGYDSASFPALRAPEYPPDCDPPPPPAQRVLNTISELANQRGLHETVVAYGQAAYVVRDRLVATRGQVAARAIETMETHCRARINEQQAAAHALHAIRDDEFHYRIFAEKHERSVRSSIVASFESTAREITRYDHHRDRLFQAESTTRADVQHQEATARSIFDNKDVQRRLARMGKYCTQRAAFVDAEASARRALQASCSDALCRAKAAWLEDLERHGRRVLARGAHLTSSTLIEMCDEVLGIPAAALRAAAKPQWLPPSAADFSHQLMLHRYGTDRVVAAAPRGPDLYERLRAGVAVLIGAGLLGYEGYASVAVPLLQFTMGEALLRMALHDGEDRCRRELILLAGRGLAALPHVPHFSAPRTRHLSPPRAHGGASVTVGPIPASAPTAHELFELGDLDRRGRLTLPSVVAVLRLAQRAEDIRTITRAYNAAVDEEAAHRALTAREGNKLRHHDGVDPSGLARILQLLAADRRPTFS